MAKSRKRAAKTSRPAKKSKGKHRKVPDLLALPDNCVRDAGYVRFDREHRMSFTGQLNEGETIVGTPCSVIRNGDFTIESIRVSEGGHRVSFLAKRSNRNRDESRAIRLLEIWAPTSQGRTIGRLIHVRNREYVTGVFGRDFRIDFSVQLNEGESIINVEFKDDGEIAILEWDFQRGRVVRFTVTKSGDARNASGPHVIEVWAMTSRQRRVGKILQIPRTPLLAVVHPSMWEVRNECTDDALKVATGVNAKKWNQLKQFHDDLLAKDSRCNFMSWLRRRPGALPMPWNAIRRRLTKAGIYEVAMKWRAASTREAVCERAGFVATSVIKDGVRDFPELEDWLVYGGEAPSGWRIASEAELRDINKMWDVCGHSLVAATERHVNFESLLSPLVAFMVNLPCKWAPGMARMFFGEPPPQGLMCIEKTKQQMLRRIHYHRERARKIGRVVPGKRGTSELEAALDSYLHNSLPTTAGIKQAQTGIVFDRFGVGLCILKPQFTVISTVASTERPRQYSQHLRSLRNCVGEGPVDAWMLANISKSLTMPDASTAIGESLLVREPDSQLATIAQRAYARVLERVASLHDLPRNHVTHSVRDYIREFRADRRDEIAAYLFGGREPRNTYVIPVEVDAIKAVRSDNAILIAAGSSNYLLDRWQRHDHQKYELYQEIRRKSPLGHQFDRESSLCWQTCFGNLENKPWEERAKLARSISTFDRILIAMDWKNCLTRAKKPYFDLGRVLEEAKQKCGQWGADTLLDDIENRLQATEGKRHNRRGVIATGPRRQLLYRPRALLIDFRRSALEIRPDGFSLNDLVELGFINESAADIFATAGSAPSSQALDKIADHSDDYRSVRWRDERFTFTADQAAVVRILWEHWERGVPDMSQDALLEESEIAQQRLANVFRKRVNGKMRPHPAWNNFIVPSGNRGAFRLNLDP